MIFALQVGVRYVQLLQCSKRDQPYAQCSKTCRAGQNKDLPTLPEAGSCCMFECAVLSGVEQSPEGPRKSKERIDRTRRNPRQAQC